MFEVAGFVLVFERKSQKSR